MKIFANGHLALLLQQVWGLIYNLLFGNGSQDCIHPFGFWPPSSAAAHPADVGFGHNAVILTLSLTPNQQRRYSTDRLICQLLSKPLLGPICLIEAICPFY